MSSIIFDGIGKVYPGGTRAIYDVNIEVGDGEFVVLVGQAPEFGAKVAGPVGDVVESGPPAGQESTHRRVGVQGLQEFQVAHEGDADTLLREGLGPGTGRAAQAFVEW